MGADMTILWDDSYRMGNDAMDAQHKHLFLVINELAAIDNLRELRPLILQLYKYTREHFEDEEALMRRVGFPNVEEHTEHHNQLLSRLSLLSMDVGKGHMSRSAIQAVMSNWATLHVLNDDAQLAGYLASHPDK